MADCAFWTRGMGDRTVAKAIQMQETRGPSWKPLASAQSRLPAKRRSPAVPPPEGRFWPERFCLALQIDSPWDVPLRECRRAKQRHVQGRSRNPRIVRHYDAHEAHNARDTRRLTVGSVWVHLSQVSGSSKPASKDNMTPPSSNF